MAREPARRPGNPAVAPLRAEADGSGPRRTGARVAAGCALAAGDRGRCDARAARHRRRARAFRARRQRCRRLGRRCGDCRRAQSRGDDSGTAGGDPRRGALADRLARPAPVLCTVRQRERCRCRRLEPGLPELPGASLSARRSGRDHARGARRALPLGARPAPGRNPIFLSRRLYGARRNDRGSSAPRGPGGIGGSASAACAISPRNPGRFHRR